LAFLKSWAFDNQIVRRMLQSTKEDKAMNDREKTSYRLINHPGKTHPVTCAALARLAAHQHRIALRQRYFCWALVESPKKR
tara:strand:+ start:305 stop:547 length:243 start_codon:yes stop_codon:yes gene_type:complete